MFDILFHINLFISLIELEHPLKTSQKRRFIKEHTLLYLFISLIEVEHPLKTSNKKTHCKFKIDKITYSKS